MTLPTDPNQQASGQHGPAGAGSQVPVRSGVENVPAAGQDPGGMAAGPAAALTGKRPARLPRMLMIVLAGVGFVVAAYLIVPKFAAGSGGDDALTGVRQQLNQAVADKTDLARQLSQAQTALAKSQDLAKKTADYAEAKQTELFEAEKRAGDLDARLKAATGIAAQTAGELTGVKAELAKLQTQADQAGREVQSLTAQLASAKTTGTQLDETRKRLETARADLEKRLQAQKDARTHLENLLEALDLGQEGAAAPTPRSPAEMPITAKELMAALGAPTVIVRQNDREDIRWGTDHRAISDGGVVTEINGRPAERKDLPKPAGGVGSPAGAWRFGTGQAVSYADLVGMFGQPEGVVGKGTDFTAWWSVGAWARAATARVVDGMVREFAGKPVDAGLCCSLVRQRAEAYRPDQPEARAWAAAAKAFHEQAAKVLDEQLRRESDLNARDGERLKEWRLAPFDSVATWIARTAGLGEGAMTLRARVDCTWVKPDGTTRAQRRFVVLSLARKGAEVDLSQYVVLAPRT